MESSRPPGSTALGAGGEALAVALLMGLGLAIVGTHVRPLGGARRGEIDIVACDGGTLVFVEVKTRRQPVGRDAAPGEAVDLRKRRQLVTLAEAYLAKAARPDAPCRFDVVEVSGPPGTQRLRHLRNAFDANDI